MIKFHHIYNQMHLFFMVIDMIYLGSNVSSVSFFFIMKHLNIWTHFFGVILSIWYLFRDFILVSQQNEHLFSTNNFDD